ncbi:MAG: hypothetical protein GF370_00785 [Candidatus Nealsonbacteria bacterium]|nr:hypothetical protein [Candidatus Nealsonbacteria bacterium]
MKKIHFIFILISLISFIAFQKAYAVHEVSHYQTASSIREMIQKLQQQIAALEKQLAEAEKGGSAWCYNFSSDLKYGDKGNAVKALHQALEKKGFSIPDDEEGNNFFGPHTASAVTGFQQKFKKEVLTPWGLTNGTGFVGETTRAKLNNLFGCDSQAPSKPGEGETPKKPEETPAPALWSWNHCSLSNKCKAGEGDCDKNSECLTGYCAHNVGANYGQTAGMDVCEQKPDTCADSDGGKNYYQKGKACQGDDCEYDECLYPDCGPEADCVGVDDYLVEFYCMGGELKSENYTCPSGCEDGACIKKD